MITVIVPIYNAEKYLEKCVESILTNSITGLELILVNDGSTDNSLALCRKLQTKYTPFITVIDKKNEGVSVARNAGIEIAKNEWITFVDADDCVNETLIANYENIINSNNPNVDLLVTGYAIFDDFQNCLGSFSPKHSNAYLRADNGIQTLFEEVGDNLDARGWLCTFVCNKAYRRDILNQYNIRFKPGLGYGEDFLFNAEYYRYINGISTISKPLYYYYKRGSGATSRFWGGTDLIDRRCLFYETSIEMSRNLNLDKEYDDVLKKVEARLIFATLGWVFGSGKKLNTQAKLQHCRELCENYKYGYLLENCPRNRLSLIKRIMLDLLLRRAYMLYLLIGQLEQFIIEIKRKLKVIRGKHCVKSGN